MGVRLSPRHSKLDSVSLAQLIYMIQALKRSVWSKIIIYCLLSSLLIMALTYRVSKPVNSAVVAVILIIGLAVANAAVRTYGLRYRQLVQDIEHACDETTDIQLLIDAVLLTNYSEKNRALLAKAESAATMNSNSVLTSRTLNQLTDRIEQIMCRDATEIKMMPTELRASEVNMALVFVRLLGSCAGNKQFERLNRLSKCVVHNDGARQIHDLIVERQSTMDYRNGH